MTRLQDGTANCQEVAGRPSEYLSKAQSADVASRLLDLGQALSALRTFLLFIGYSRSGHTMVGSLLDGHPRMVISNELNALERPAASLRKDIANNAAVCAVYGRMQAGFNYSLGGRLEWQGRWCGPAAEARWCAHGAPLVLGDKRGGGTSNHLKSLGVTRGVERLRSFGLGVSLRVRLVHVVRNPYDMAATQFLTLMSEGNWHSRDPAANSSAGSGVWHELGACEANLLARWADHYSSHLLFNADLRAELERSGGCACALPPPGAAGASSDGGVRSVRHCLQRAGCSTPKPDSKPGDLDWISKLGWLDFTTEGFQRLPREHLEAICELVGVECGEAFLQAASALVRPSRHATSALVRWPAASVLQVSSRLEKAAHLAPALRPLLDAYAPPRTKTAGREHTAASLIASTKRRYGPNCVPFYAQSGRPVAGPKPTPKPPKYRLASALVEASS